MRATWRFEYDDAVPVCIYISIFSAAHRPMFSSLHDHRSSAILKAATANLMNRIQHSNHLIETLEHLSSPEPARFSSKSLYSIARYRDGHRCKWMCWLHCLRLQNIGRMYSFGVCQPEIGGKWRWSFTFLLAFTERYSGTGSPHALQCDWLSSNFISDIHSEYVLTEARSECFSWSSGTNVHTPSTTWYQSNPFYRIDTPCAILLTST